MKGKIHVGTSGWHYKHWVGTFYPPGTKDLDQLTYYIRFFKTVELNNSFYRLPPSQKITNWRKFVPTDFIFSVKASRYITHAKKLNLGKDNIRLFFNSVRRFKEKLGPILFQLPPRWKLNADRLHHFLRVLPKKYRYTFEFRDPSWYNDEVYKLLRKYNCAFCIYELGGYHSPIITTADFVYIRLHGPGAKYSGSYPKNKLKKWAVLCENWSKQGKEVFIYFDNDQAGYAAFNAQTIQNLLNKGD
jgi:uncharacterized protein YecE (DUF72 family)